MKEDIIKIIKQNAGTNLSDMALLNPEKISDKITSHVMEFLRWEKENSCRFEYYTVEHIYNIWKNK